MRLTDAIEGNKRGLVRLIAYRSTIDDQINELRTKSAQISKEIAARDALQLAMERLQVIMPENEKDLNR